METEGKVIKCKAAVVYVLNSPVKVEEIYVSPPPAEHVRVKMVATALCHSDFSVMSGYKASVALPYIPGHEGAGIVESVGQGVTSVKKGDKVFTMFFPHCGECRLCKGNKTNLCFDHKRKEPILPGLMRPENLDGSISFSTLDGKPIYHGYGCASFSEYTVIPVNSCVKVDPGTNLKNGCIMACGFLTGYGSSTNTVQLQEGDKVGVWGLGGVGLACVVGCREKKAGQIIGIDVSEEKETLGRKFGVTDYVALSKLGPNKSVRDKVLELTTDGLDYAFVCIGSPKALEDAYSCLSHGGTVVMIGAVKATDQVTLPIGKFIYSHKIIGAIYGDLTIFEDVPKLVKRYADGHLPEIDSFVTNFFKLGQLNEAVQLMKQGKGIRSVVDFEMR